MIQRRVLEICQIVIFFKSIGEKSRDGIISYLYGKEDDEATKKNQQTYYGDL